MSDIRVCDNCGAARRLRGIHIEELGSLTADLFVIVDSPGRMDGPLTFCDEDCLREYYARSKAP